MSNNYQKQILSILVDWYEDSPAHVRNHKPDRRRMMKLCDKGKTDFSVYNIENSIVRKDINQAVLDLADKGYIDFEWMRGEKNHIISRLWLNFESILHIYTYLGRKPKADEVDEVLLQLKTVLEQIKEGWAYLWLEETYSLILRKRAIGNSLPENKSERDDLFKVILYLSKKTEAEILERVFSIQCFGDSKRFERSVKMRLIRILRKYLVQDECNDDEVLRLVGIVRYPELFEFSGPLSIMLPNGFIDFSHFPFGGTLNTDDIKHGKIVLGTGIQRILSIENRANYIDYIRKSQLKNELVLFHGGQFSPAKGLFLKKVTSVMPEGCTFYHWGDIDFGGFSMLARLRREIIPDVQAWKMGIKDLEQYSKYTIPFSQAYRKRLAALLEVPQLSDCFSCIEFMLKNGIRLEHEAMLI